jgi:hypothetical protein
MNSHTKVGLASVMLATILTLMLLAVVFSPVKLANSQGLTGGSSASDCTITTSSFVAVGATTSATILSGHSRRAWASIQQPRNATNTVALSFDEGAAAVLGSGYQLFDMATSTGEASKVVFGLNTDLPYTGAVTGITSSGTSSVLVTECRY